MRLLSQVFHAHVWFDDGRPSEHCNNKQKVPDFCSESLTTKTPPDGSGTSSSSGNGSTKGGIKESHCFAQASKPEKALANEGTSLSYLHKIKEVAKLAHKHAKKTRNNYNGYVAQGIKWLEGHFAPDNLTEGPGTEGGSIKGAASDELYEDPEFRHAFDPIPNHCSDKALTLFISWKCFRQNGRKSTLGHLFSI